MSNYAHTMEKIEELLAQIPVEELRQDVVYAESMEGKVAYPALHSGRSFELHTRRARLWLDFIDDWQALLLEKK